jgi:nitroreductase
MEFFDLIEKRRSVRMYQDKPVPEDILMKIVEAARQAPSAGNLQPYELFIVRDTRIKEELVQAAYGQGFIARAPVVLIFAQDASRSESRYGFRGCTMFVYQDTAISATMAHMAAVDLGLGSCWVGAFDSPAVARILDLRAGLVPSVILPIGYPAEEPVKSPRRELKDFAHENKICGK